MPKKEEMQDLTPKLPLLSVKARVMRECSFIVVAGLAIFLAFALWTFHPTDPSWWNVHTHGAIENAMGKVGAYLAATLLMTFGFVGYVIPVFLIYCSFLLWYRAFEAHEGMRWGVFAIRFVALLIALVALSVLCQLYPPLEDQVHIFFAGGIVGNFLASVCIESFNVKGTVLVFLILLLTMVSIFSGLSWFYCFQSMAIFVSMVVQSVARFVYQPQLLGKAFQGLGRGIIFSLKGIKNLFKRTPKLPALVTKKSIVTQSLPQKTSAVSFEKTQSDVDGKKSHEKDIAQKPVPKTSSPSVPYVSSEIHADTDEEELVITTSRFVSTMAEGSLPPLSLLDTPKHQPETVVDPEVLEELAKHVEARLFDFGIQAKVMGQYPGPVVTRFELELSPGTKVSKITTLSKDLARSLSVLSVRVVEVIPGKSYIALELPNPKRAIVFLQEILDSSAYLKGKAALSLGLGKDIAGHAVVVDLAKMPHLLVAGTTGSGKSVCLNALLLSLLYQSTPRHLRLILIDPKMLELAIYDGIPHLLTPVVTDMKDAACALRWCVAEMERRYRLMASLGVRNIAGYNVKVEEAAASGHPLTDSTAQVAPGMPQPVLDVMPRIVVLADEYADMMVVVGKKVETLIARLAQKARAAGIHLILATQRPSVDVITGLIKANIPTRIAFQVSSKIDSRTIIDQQGAEQLLGHGDMLYLPPGSGVSQRVHGAYVSDDEVHRVVEYLKQTAEPNYEEAIVNEKANTTSGDAMIDQLFAPEDGVSDAEKDEFYDQAVEMVIQSRRVSISSIQRRFRIGYNRAATIVEAMEVAGIVSAMETNGSREVLVPKREDS
jgi:S-DNA-T family DNA segregation ATPase FtsK/SpoIIIE